MSHIPLQVQAQQQHVGQGYYVLHPSSTNATNSINNEAKDQKFYKSHKDIDQKKVKKNI